MADVAKERDIYVHSYRMPPDINNSIKMEVGIEDCLHIEFEYNKSKYAFRPLYVLPASNVSTRYHLKDVIVGKIYFLLVRIKIKHTELSIIRRETTGAPPNQYNESETITKYEIMDGAPIRGEYPPYYITRSLTDSRQAKPSQYVCSSVALNLHPLSGM